MDGDDFGFLGIQRLAKVDAPGLMIFITAVADHDHVCLNLPALFTKPGASTLAPLCISSTRASHALSEDQPSSVGWTGRWSLYSPLFNSQMLRMKMRSKNPFKLVVNVTFST